MVLVQLVVKLVDFGCDFFQGFSACGSDLVDTPPVATNLVEARLEQTGPFQSVQERVESAGTDAITVVFQFVHHCEPEDGLVRGVDQHVNTNQSVIEFALMISHTINISPPGEFCLACYRSSIYSPEQMALP